MSDKPANNFNEQKPSLFLTKTLAKTKTALIYVGIFSLFINMLMLVIPIYMLQIYDRVLPSHSYETLLYLSLIATFMLVIYAFLDRARGHIMARVSAWLGLALGPEALLRGPDKILRGDPLVHETLQDIMKVRTFLASPALTTLFDAPWMPIYIAVIFMLHPILGVISILGALLLFVFAIANELSTRKLTAEATLASTKSQLHVTATLKNAESIQAMGMMPAIVDQWAKENTVTSNKLTQANLRSASILAASKTLRMLLQIIMLGVGAYLVVDGVFSGGVMIAGTILLARALAPVEQAIGSWKQFILARESYHRLQQYFSKPLARHDSMALPPPLGTLRVEGLIYAVPQANKIILDNIQFQLNPGESLGIIGPSAAGKSSLARLLVGAWQPTRGHVRLDGAEIYEWDREDFGKYVGYLPQDVQLFASTIKDNIARMGTVDPQAVVEAAKMAQAHELILKLDHGYDTDLHTSAQALSGGQRQRIALARALYRLPKLVVLDEPNANLDEAGLNALVMALEKLQAAKSTVVLITHHPALIQHVGKILVMQAGKMTALGPRADILAQFSKQKPSTPTLSASYVLG